MFRNIDWKIKGIMKIAIIRDSLPAIKIVEQIHYNKSQVLIHGLCI
jgi:hypothetical protein